MKVVVLIPVKNEEWIIDIALKNYSSFADHIIVADQRSTDRTREISKQYPKVTLIENPYQGHTNEIRWLLLDEARKIPGNNLIVYLDADELISPDFISEVKSLTLPENKSVAFESRWVQLCGSYDTHRVDGVWQDSSKQFAFIDNREINYDREVVTNDHSNRIPATDIVVRLKTPILHLQYLAQTRCELKQAFYMCTELLGGRSIRRVNNRYEVAFFDHVKLDKVEEGWWHDIEKPPLSIFETYDEQKLRDLENVFEKHGFTYFERLRIWHIPLLRERFISHIGRTPKKPLKYPSLLVYLNNIKNKLKYQLKNATLAPK